MNAADVPDGHPDFEAVHVAGVSRYYGRRRALAKVSLECRSGTMTGLFGPNGAGKSTLLGILSTLIQASQGSVRYGTRTADEWGDGLRLRIGALGHDLFLYGDLTARENLEFFGRLHGTPRLEARIEEALAAARLVDRADDRVSGFSRGLRQRLALERALLHDPKLVLLDEPFTGLDDASSGLLVERLRTLRASGAIVVMATHDFDTADGLVDRAMCLENGRLTPVVEQGGSLRERYRRTLQEAGTR
jgi:ABC-type multidrug transport system ATPase subunit